MSALRVIHIYIVRTNYPSKTFHHIVNNAVFLYSDGAVPLRRPLFGVNHEVKQLRLRSVIYLRNIFDPIPRVAPSLIHPFRSSP